MAGKALTAERQGASPDDGPFVGARILLMALEEQGVEVVFGYPGGAVLPIYDELFKQNRIRHVLVRHEQGAVHAAEGYARSTGKVGCVLVTSGPGATNTVTGLTDALLDSIPLVCLTGQVPTHLIGNDAFQEADTVGITRPCTKHNYLVKDVNLLAQVVHEAFYVARSGRPGPVVVDLPKDVCMAMGHYTTAPRGNLRNQHKTYRPKTKPDAAAVAHAVALMAAAKKPVFYTGGGVINSGPKASALLRELVELTGFPITSTLMGLGAYPAAGAQWLGMLGMHGTYEANLAMHGCDLLINIGARFDDRVTGNLKYFSPGSKKIHVDIDASSINKNIIVDIGIVGDCAAVLEEVLALWKAHPRKPDSKTLRVWWRQIADWRGRDCLHYEQRGKLIKPQYAIQRLYELTKKREPYITTEVGQHQMWAAQYFRFEQPNHWMTSGGLGTMGYGLPAAIGVQMAHRDSLVIDIAGEASILMNIQELSTAVQHHLPVKVFIINNKYMGMVRQWQELLHGGRYSESYSAALPDFVKLAEAFGCAGLRVSDPAKVDDTIRKMIAIDRPVICDVVVDQKENCFPMIPSGKAHNEMILGSREKAGKAITGGGLALV
ncbi:MAG: acetolactate synthase 3 large subunit [Rhodospirillaceae bacterium]|nr:acetolactate synthase 3 large subunit [Rhodospirillaceae bacterium]